MRLVPFLLLLIMGIGVGCIWTPRLSITVGLSFLAGALAARSLKEQSRANDYTLAPSEPLIRVSPKGKIVAITPEATRALSLAGDLIGRSIDHILASEQKNSFLQIVQIHETIDGTRLFHVRSSFKQWDLISRVLNGTGDAIVLTDKQGKISYVNYKFCELADIVQNEVIGRTIFDILDVSAVKDLVWSTLSTDAPFRGRINFTNSKSSKYSVEVTLSALNVQGEMHIIGVLRDITHEITVDAKLRQAQKLEAIGTLAGGLAHDFNNILQVIIGYSEIAVQDLKPSTISHDCLLEVRRAGARAQTLVEHLLKFSRQSEHVLYPLELSSTVKETLKFIRSTLPSSIRLECDINKCGLVKSDPTEIHQLLTTLCAFAFANTQKSTSCIKIELTTVTISNEDDTNDDIEHGNYACLSITTTWENLDEHSFIRLFEPYYHRENKIGTLSLAACHGIVQDHNGYFRLRRAGHPEVSIQVLLPLEEEVSESSSKSDICIPIRSRVILVDDEPTVLDVTKQALERFGCHVIAFKDPLAAQEAVLSGLDFDVLITDQTMPNLSGLELSRRVLSVFPNVPIILCTGFSETVNEELANKAGIKAFILKPYALREMADKIFELTGEKGTSRG